MELCKRCGKQVDRTYDGLCTGCLAGDAALDVQDSFDAENELPDIQVNEPLSNEEIAEILYGLGQTYRRLYNNDKLRKDGLAE